MQIILKGDYLYTTLERYKPEPQGYKRHFTILKNQDVCFTENMEEQQKIGVFFKQLDATITLHQRKLDRLKSVKQAYLSEMFPLKESVCQNAVFLDLLTIGNCGDFPELAEIRRDWETLPVNIRLEGIRVLRSSNIDEDTFTFGEDDVFVDKGVVKSPLVKEGDILITAANGSSRLVGNTL